VNPEIRPGQTDTLAGELGAALGPNFVLGDVIASGVMARVYRARDTRLGRDIVVKTLNPDLIGHLSVERFEREIHLAASLQEPHIVPLLDAGHTSGGLPYYTMPFVAGESLRARMERGTLTTRETSGVLRDIARALAFAHARGVVHRDIKPENVLLTGDTAVVLDFGIAKALMAADQDAPRNDSTGIGFAVGTPAYMAPEQAVGDPAVDQRADFYAWGLVAYELLAGRHPFAHRVTQHALLAAHLTEIPTPLRELQAGMPETLDAIVMACLAKDPADRPAAAAELLTALDASDTASSASPRRRISERTFRLTDDVCRRLDRATLDPRVIGDAMHYLENDAPPDILLFCLPGVGQDASQFEHLLVTSKHRVIAATQYGFEPATNSERVPLTVEAHMTLLGVLLKESVARLTPAKVIIIGFSSGGDLALRMLAEPAEDAVHVDACLAIGPNLSLATCFASRVFAELRSEGSSDALAGLRNLGSDAADLEEWLNLMSYVLYVLRKFGGVHAPLRLFAAGIVRAFTEDPDVFAKWFRAASSRVTVVRCVFERSAIIMPLIQALRLRNLDSGLLGPRATDDSLVLDSTTDHLALLGRIDPHIAAVVAAVG
jgi:serine/threonine protein kinase